jgi:hypothetical protein
MGRVGALSTPLVDQSELPELVQQRIQELPFGLAVDQAGAEFAEHRVVEAGIGQLQGQGALPVDTAAHGVGGLAVGQTLDVLEDGDQSQPCRRSGRLASGGEQLGELIVTVEATELVSDAEAESAFGEGGVGDAVGLFGDRMRRLGAK